MFFLASIFIGDMGIWAGLAFFLPFALNAAVCIGTIIFRSARRGYCYLRLRARGESVYPDTHMAFPHSLDEYALSGLHQTSKWIVDTGATAHMSKRKSHRDPWQTRDRITIHGAASDLLSEGIAEVKGLPGVLVVPRMQPSGLLSVRQVIDHSRSPVYLRLRKFCCAPPEEQQRRHRGPRVGDLYFMCPAEVATHCHAARSPRCLP